MADTLTPSQRSERMARVMCKDSRPELKVRRLAFRLGYRFRLHGKGLPGRPDMVFGRLKKVVFIHGCFWHRHEGCVLNRMPKSRSDFWTRKFEENQARDSRNALALIGLGWKSLVIWECETRDETYVTEMLNSFLGSAA